jgi:SAM-dependent methyltransferase
MDSTKDYYKKNADSFIQGTLKIDMGSIYEKFVPLLPPGGKILDAGCGSGRDSLYFNNKGFRVLAIDSCEEFAGFTRDYAGVEAKCMSFAEVNFNNEFDGIWACASLLHLSHVDLTAALKKLSDALKPGGILYASFKYGDFSGERNGRTFTDLDEKCFSELLKEIQGLKIIETWITVDQRKERVEEKWLNALLKK